jgi:hypothetical protein
MFATEGATVIAPTVSAADQRRLKKDQTDEALDR